MKRLLLIPALFSILLISSCSSGSDDDDMGPPPPSNKVTYTGTVKAIIDAHCISCHNNPPVNNAPMSLTTYDNVKSAVQTRGLIGKVESGAMPPVGEDLTLMEVQAIKDWEAGGFLE